MGLIVPKIRAQRLKGDSDARRAFSRGVKRQSDHARATMRKDGERGLVRAPRRKR